MKKSTLYLISLILFINSTLGHPAVANVISPINPRATVNDYCPDNAELNNNCQPAMKEGSTTVANYPKIKWNQIKSRELTSDDILSLPLLAYPHPRTTQHIPC